MNPFVDTDKYISTFLLFVLWPKHGKSTITCNIFVHLLSSLHALHQNSPKWRKIYMCASLYVQFWRYFKNYFYVIYFLLLTQICTKRHVNMCAKFWKNMMISLWFMDYESNWHDPGQVMHKPPGSNRVKLHLVIQIYLLNL